ncbi:Transcriptional activator protein CzcR [Pseudoalteromonas holothuriae]|uniref:Transcriptional activator protein CzcR n=1 Tax=Pseudoalteromonas holothuriae TaxID=2963714 RepID=A0A9W4R2F4_9GAMM|nr:MULTISPECIES: response regulator transcription factor [unclassified Pseudoalteromonas]CAH9063664.1 Transcriptional activator protein CzcR [Pseudoalteromonas sp. CIP111854]CAH9064731.1 Transcriptional activator protein CzcR [Pseudoalteromonas sp. CIP111951]
MIILLVEDDTVLATHSINFLAQEGIEVDYASTVKQAQAISEQQQYDAIVLDINLPDGDGLSLAKLWQGTRDEPILFLSARDKLDDKLKAFSLGALDYLTKPFALAELAVRIKLLANKTLVKKSTTFKLDSLSVDLQAKIITRGQRVIILSPQQWLLLSLLIEHYPNPVNKSCIINHIWPDEDTNNNMYKSLLTRLRTNLSRDEEVPLLHTLKKQGLVLRVANA